MDKRKEILTLHYKIMQMIGEYQQTINFGIPLIMTHDDKTLGRELLTMRRNFLLVRYLLKNMFLPGPGYQVGKEGCHEHNRK